MILAAGRGERMRPLTDHCPKALLPVGGKPLIEWHLEKLAAAGIDEVVINLAHLGEQIESHCGDGRRFGISIHYARESVALETAGGIATALPLLGEGAIPIVSADVFSDFDYGRLVERARAIGAASESPRLHLVMVDNPDFHARGDFALDGSRLTLAGTPALTFASLGVYDLSLFRGLPPGVKLKLTPFYREWVARGLANGEHFRGLWHNVGTPEQLQRLNAQFDSLPH